MPLVLTRFDVSIPLNTVLSVVFRIELLVVDKDEIPKVITVPPFKAPAIRLP